MELLLLDIKVFWKYFFQVLNYWQHCRRCTSKFNWMPVSGHWNNKKGAGPTAIKLREREVKIGQKI